MLRFVWVDKAFQNDYKACEFSVMLYGWYWDLTTEISKWKTWYIFDFKCCYHPIPLQNDYKACELSDILSSSTFFVIIEWLIIFLICCLGSKMMSLHEFPENMNKGSLQKITISDCWFWFVFFASFALTYT